MKPTTLLLMLLLFAACNGSGGTSLGNNYSNDLEIKNSKWHSRFLVGGVTVEGFILNKSETNGYKDVVLEVSYYSATETLLSTERLTIYQYFYAGQLVPFKVHGSDIDDMETCSVQIVDATPL
jgi:hypothetical protein